MRAEAGAMEVRQLASPGGQVIRVGKGRLHVCPLGDSPIPDSHLADRTQQERPTSLCDLKQVPNLSESAVNENLGLGDTSGFPAKTLLDPPGFHHLSGMFPIQRLICLLLCLEIN